MASIIRVDNLAPYSGSTVTISNLTVSQNLTASYNAPVSTSFAVTASYVENLPYPRVYVAKLTQSGSQAPTASVIANTLGFTPNWVRQTTGTYYFDTVNITASSPSKITPFISPNSGSNILSSFEVSSSIAGYRVILTSRNLSTAVNDGQLINTPIEIILYQ